MRIREDSGDTETDIGYDSNNELDTAAIASHCGTANGFVVSWVDQSSNSNDADQSTTTAQPKIYDGTTQAVITENGKPIITSSSNAYMQTAYDGNAIFFSVAQPLDGSILGQYDLTSGGGSNSNGWLYMAEAAYGGGAFGSDITINSARKNGSAYSTTGADADQIYTDFNGQNLLYTSLSTASQNLNFGYRPGPGVFPMWSMQEFIIYPDTSTHTPSDIEDNINSEYLIYQPTDAPTSGLLATYTGAAAAYSVRQLSDKAVLALRIRRDSDDVEQNFGFDTNGDLDTAGIASFCGTANGYVTRWWDQSTNGNHSDQATDASQPQIYNGTAVITENGKPAARFDGTNDFIKNDAAVTQATTFVMVNTWPAQDGDTHIMMDGINFTGGRQGFAMDSDLGVRLFADSGVYGTDPMTAGDQTLSTGIFNGTSSTLRLNGSAVSGISAGTQGADGQTLGAGVNGGLPSDMDLQEFILWDSDQSTPTDNRTGIETDVNTYFSIYT